MSSSSSPITPNFSHPLPSSYSNMGTPSRQPQATSRDEVAASYGVLPRTTSAHELDSRSRPPLSASLSQPADTAQKTHLPRKTNSAQNLPMRFPTSPAPILPEDDTVNNEIEREVSLNDFLKEQWQPQTSTLPFSTDQALIAKSSSKMDLRRQANLPGRERQLSKDSKASDHSDKTIVQKLLNRKPSNSSLSSVATANDKLREASRDHTSSDQIAFQYPDMPQPNNGRPILNFRASLWKHLDTKRDKLSINLFWPKKIEDLHDEDYDEQANMFPYDAMKPLLNFTNLRSLTLNGMERSYQRIIWQTVFRNPQLYDLTLEMALSPVITRDALPQCMKVNKGWIFPVPTRGWAPVTYLGHHGEGVLHDEFGDGEYLDSRAMELAHDDTFGADSQGLHLLSISKLTIMGFVIDAGPFFRWFDAQKLRTIVLKDNCFDSGFFLPPAMRGRTHVLLGGSLVEQQKLKGQVIKPGEVKLVTLSKGRVVDEEAVETVQKPRQGGQLKKKSSGIMRKWQTKEKETEVE